MVVGDGGCATLLGGTDPRTRLAAISHHQPRSTALTDQTDPTSADRAHAMAQAAADKLGTGTVILEVGEVLSIVEYFVITSAPNSRQVRAIAEEVEDQLKREGGPGPIRVEGLGDGTWVLLDYGDVVVHVFLDETREFYDLERLWRDVPRIDVEAGSPAVGE